MRCSREGCSEAAVVDQPYAGEHLCRSHFLASVRERVRRELHRQVPRLRGGVMAVALSGGKDSATLLSLLQELLGDRRGVRLVAITIDEGISGYRGGTLEKARDLCERLGVEHVVRSFREELGTTTEEAVGVPTDGSPCAACGVWRRVLLNRAARELQAVRLALGFNLDDLAQTVLMNLVRGEPHRLRQMAPHRFHHPGLVPRIAPLAPIPEREVYLYAALTEIPFDHSRCPHADRAGRNLFRDVLWRLEDGLPGTRHALLRTRERILPLLDGAGPGVPGICLECGEASSGGICRPCTYLRVIRHARENPFVFATGSGAG
jgi:uncharacterized protein (TIGR00269 family)